MTAAILSGGRARRFGGAQKGALVVGGRSILDRQLAELRLVACRVLIVGGQREGPPLPGVETVSDLVAGCGPLGGLFTALFVAREAVIAVAGDLPFLSAPFLEHLASLAGPGVDAVMPRTGDGLQPLCALYLPSALEPISARLQAARYKVADLRSDLRVVEVGPDVVSRFDPGGRMLFNVNTPADHARAEAMASNA